MNDFAILAAAAGGMEAQRGALDVAARNVARAQTADPGHPVHRLVARFEIAAPATVGDTSFADVVPDVAGDDGAESFDAGFAGDAAFTPAAVRFAGAAPSDGMVDTVTEMVSALDAQRAYESNASIFELGKRLAERTIDIGRT